MNTPEEIKAAAEAIAKMRYCPKRESEAKLREVKQRRDKLQQEAEDRLIESGEYDLKMRLNYAASGGMTDKPGKSRPVASLPMSHPLKQTSFKERRKREDKAWN